MIRISKHLIGAAVLGAIALATRITLAQSLCPAEEDVFLFDKSDSMFDDGSDSIPKWQMAAARAKTHYKSLQPDSVVSIQGFANAQRDLFNYRQVYVPFSQNLRVGRDDAAILAQLDAASFPGFGATSLAGGVCDALEDLQNFRPDCLFSTTTRQLFLESDGLENATPSNHACYSNFASNTPFDVTAKNLGFGLQRDSWNWKVANKAWTGNPTLPAFTDMAGNVVVNPRPVVTNIDVLFTFLSGLPAAKPGVDGPAGGSGNLQEDVDALGVAFFKGLAAATFGTYSEATRVNGRPTVIPVPGDTNPLPTNSCVDNVDLSRIVQVQNRRVQNSDPLYTGSDLAQRDVNNDLVINALDYYLAVDHYGECAAGSIAPPPPVAVPIPRGATSALALVLAGLGVVAARPRQRRNRKL